MRREDWIVSEFDEHCLPNRHRTGLKIETPIENQIFRVCDNLFEEKSDSSLETFNKQVRILFECYFIHLVPVKVGIFPLKSDLSPTSWHLYRINHQLGFVVPCESIKVNLFFSKLRRIENSDLLVTEISHLRAQ